MSRFQPSSPIIASILALWLLASPGSGSAETADLGTVIQDALEANLDLKITQANTEAAESLKRVQKTNFLPTFTASYEYIWHDEERRSLGVLTRPQDETSVSASIIQPIFTGFSIINQYKIAELGLDIAKIQENLQRQQIIFDAKNAYFSVLRAGKLVAVAEQAVASLTANQEVSKNFYDVGMIPYNDLLEAEVELANARQDRIVARNQLENARSNFNTLLRRPIGTPVMLRDILGFEPFRLTLEVCLEEAENERPEIPIADLQVQLAEREIDLARKDYFPRFDLRGTYFRNESGFLVGSGEPVGFIEDPDGWDIIATASWDFWQWGRKRHGVREKLSRLSQARYEQERTLDNIRLEVKQAFLNTKDSESNIIAVEKAVEQAEENLRITEERFKEQIATSKDVLDAQTLLTRTQTNYFNAIYDFEISKALLYRAIGREVLE